MHHLDLDQVIRDVIEICQPQLEVRRQTITTDLRASNRQVMGDPSRLRQVFWNLLQNASKFSPPGESIEIRSEDIGENRVRITVADRGLGLAPDEAARLFMPFESATPPAKRGMGLGLGLSICRGIIEGHGGEISGTSAGPGEGATFAVDLTASALLSFANVETSSPTDRAPVLTGDHLEPLRILLVEDDRDSGDMLSALLAHLGHDVTLAGSVADAAFHVEQSWDVVISDIGLPDGSGLEIGRRFREQGGSQPLLIAMSGYGTSSDIGASRQAGFDEHLVKPFDFNLLLAALRRPALS
jgi:CheY-like chemotaxis protein